MKTSRILLAAAFAASMAVSCSKEIAPVNDNPFAIGKAKQISFTAVADDNIGTKTALVNDIEVEWAAEESIYVFDGTAPRAFKSDNTSQAAVVKFTGTAASAEKYYAVYPFGTISGSTITATIPVFQAATPGSFAPRANVAVACTTKEPTGENVLKFKNVGALVSFKLSNSDVRKVRLDAIGGEKLTGPVDIVYGSGDSFTSSIVDTDAKSCVILTSDTDLSADATYYFVVNPGTYAQGFRITLFKADGSFKTISNKTSNTLERNEIVMFGTLPKVNSWKKAGTVDDVLTQATTGVTGTSYTDFSGKEASSSAVYAGQCAGGNESIQLRSKNSDSGVVTTTSGGTVTKVSVVWNSNTTSGRTLNVYGKNTAYTDATDLYNENTQGTLLGTIVYGTSTELTISGDYTFIGLRSADGAMYLTSVSITWGDSSASAPSDPETLTPSTSITNLSAEKVGLTNGVARFDVESNVPWTVSCDKYYVTLSVSGNTVTVSFDDLSEGSRNAEIVITPSEGSPMSKTITQIGVEKGANYSYSFSNSTSNAASFNKLFGGTTNQAITVDHVNGLQKKLGDYTWSITTSGNGDKIYASGQQLGAKKDGTTVRDITGLILETSEYEDGINSISVVSTTTGEGTISAYVGETQLESAKSIGTVTFSAGDGILLTGTVKIVWTQTTTDKNIKVLSIGIN